MTTYVLGPDTRMVILTRDKHYQLEGVVNATVDYDDNEIRVLGSMEPLRMARPTTIEIKQVVTDDPSNIFTLLQTDPLIHRIVSSYEVDFVSGETSVLTAVIDLHDGEAHFTQDDLGEVFILDLREHYEYGTTYDPSGLEEGVEIPITFNTDTIVELMAAHHIPAGSLVANDGSPYVRVAEGGDTNIIGVATGFDRETGMVTISPTSVNTVNRPTGNETPEWLLKQMNIPYPFELYEFDYDFCAWCGMVKDVSSKHVDCALNAASEIFLRDVRNNIIELKEVVK